MRDKRECVHDKRELHMCDTDDTEHSHIHTGEKRPACTTKETYIYDKRDLGMCAVDTESVSTTGPHAKDNDDASE